jgi:hypothetical protein
MMTKSQFLLQPLVFENKKTQQQWRMVCVELELPACVNVMAQGKHVVSHTY